jgi:hypothetical protein
MEKASFLAEIYPCAGELLALAEAALRICDAYNSLERSGGRGFKGNDSNDCSDTDISEVWSTLRVTIASTMRDLGELQRSAKEAR